VSNNIGAQGTVCGGGRYDKLISEFGGGDVPGIGFATGIERLMLLMENTGVKIPNSNKVKLYIAPMGEEESKKAYSLVNSLRLNGIIAETDFMNRGIKSQFKYADKIGAEYVGVIGSDELSQNVVKIKHMIDGEEYIVGENDLLSFFNK
ncbi:MAG: His/Gly/Thr/Pro-type tRNA ligase C-terminal domain-containing protein, partial [Clostridia bacterium]|nr:His/Gly/Thr/Pro-type tRNA ligase C-terminal domain-containing protein [Clostridia bacterium]